MDRDISDSLAGVIKKREESLKNGETAIDDLLGILLQSNHAENQGHVNSKRFGMSAQEVMDECKNFYNAGQETTSVLLVWTMVLLGRYPEWQARAREEVLQVFGNQNPNFGGLSQLKIVCIASSHNAYKSSHSNNLLIQNFFLELTDIYCFLR